MRLLSRKGPKTKTKTVWVYPEVDEDATLWRLAILAAPLGLLIAGLLFYQNLGLPCHPLIGCYWWPFLVIGLAAALYFGATRPGELDEDPAKKPKAPKTKAQAHAKATVSARQLSLESDADGHLIRKDQTDEMDTSDWDLDE